MKLGSVAFAALILAVGLVYESMGMNMPRGSLAYPGPGLFPTVIGVFLIATAIGCLLQDLVSRKKTTAPPAAASPASDGAAPAKRNVGKTVQLMLLLVAYGLLLKPLGFPLAVFTFAAVAIRIFGYRKWLPTLAMAAMIAAVSYVSFVVWLKVPLPTGILESVLG